MSNAGGQRTPSTLPEKEAGAAEPRGPAITQVVGAGAEDFGEANGRPCGELNMPGHLLLALGHRRTSLPPLTIWKEVAIPSVHSVRGIMAGWDFFS